jgi:multidrug efflux pump
VGYSNGAAVRLEDIANVTDSVANVRAGGFLNGKRAIPIIIFRQPGANIINTVDRLRAELEEIKASIPAGIDVTVAMDRTTTIRASVDNVEETLVIAIVLVIIVVFMFLRNGRATLIPGIAVPVSLLGTCAIMYLCGYSIDNLSLMALTISTGFVVDDAIVVMENVTRHLEAGMTPFAAALKGAQEIGFTVMTISISLIAVFIPLLMMGGIVGRLFREFAVTLSSAILVSMLISLTTTPMMCAYLLKDERKKKHGRIYAASERVFDGMLAIYRRGLMWVLEHTGITLVVLLLTVVLNIVMLIYMPKGFFPLQDTGTLTGAVRGPEDSSYYMMSKSLEAIGQVVNADPAVANAIYFTGGGGATNTGFLFIALKPLADRKISAFDVINRLRPKLNRLTGASAFLQAGQDIRIGGRQSNAQYQYTLQADSSKDLTKWGAILLREMTRVPGLEDVSSDQQNGGRDELLTYDRMTAAKLGLNVSTLDSALYSAFGQSEVSVIRTQLNQYYVVLEVAPQYLESPAGLNSTYLGSVNQQHIPIFGVSTVQANTIPLAINHTGLFPSVTISFNLEPNISLSEATASIEAVERRLGIPSSVHGFFAGTALAYQQSLGTEWILFLTALLAVYIVLGILYENLVHPITIISTIFSATVGAMISLSLFGIDLNVISIIGLVLLIGIVKKNAIMMIDFALQAEREEGKGSADAIFEACMLRFRPIMMTTMAALFGALPLALGTGTGSELRRPLGVSIVGGLILSQMLTLFTTPALYLTFDRMRLRMKGEKKDVFHHGDLAVPSNA